VDEKKCEKDACITNTIVKKVSKHVPVEDQLLRPSIGSRGRSGIMPEATFI
jgi:hypothetical protein